MSSVLNRKARRDKSGLSEDERRKAYETGFRNGTKWAICRASNESAILSLFQMLVLLESEFSFSSRKNGKLQKVYLKFVDKLLEMNNNVDNFARKSMQDRMEKLTGIALKSTDTGLQVINLRDKDAKIT